jgi:flagellar motility protein MotE (MotC chaperone)
MQTTTATTNSANSFAQIIELEKKSKDQYEKLKNRPLSLIQIEERAIQELRKFYDVDNQTNITISIELIDDDNAVKQLAPIWKKK